MTTELIDSAAALAELCDELKTRDCIAVDTEFAREKSYYPHIGLIQIAGDGHIACIDPLAFVARDQLSALLFDASITKVFHACLQDLEVLELTLGARPCPLFDTQLATALMHQDHQVSYARLVEKELGIKLAKSETRTDWLKRPLTRAQLEYAADDVRFLLPLYEKQCDDLAAMDRTVWMQEECDSLCTRPLNNPENLSQCWTRVKGKERLRGLELAVLQQAAIWREQQAMHKDRTRKRILSDDEVIQIAIRQPNNTTELARLGRLGKLFDLVELDSLSEALVSAYESQESEWPVLKRRKLTESQAKALAGVLEQLRTRAAELGIAQGMLCNRKDAERLVLGERDLAVLKGWRLACIGHDLLKLLPDDR